MNVVAHLRNREETSKMCYKTLSKTLEKKLICLYEHEYLYDHPKIIDVCEHLLSKITSKLMIAVLFDICQWNDSNSDSSLIFVASKFATLTNDYYLSLLLDEIKTDTL